ncbi:MAG: cyclic peptide export ABC transporter [Cystobacter sp.]
MFRSLQPSEEARPPPTVREQGGLAPVVDAADQEPRGHAATSLFGLIFKEAGPKRRGLILAAALVGLTNALILKLVNEAARAPEKVDPRFILSFCLTFIVFLLCVRWANQYSASLLEAVVYRTRMRLVDKLQLLELQGLEQVGRSELYTKLSVSITNIFVASNVLSTVLSSTAVLAFAVLYLAWLSIPAALLLVVLMALGLSFYRTMSLKLGVKMGQQARVRIEFYELLTDLVSGFKEVRLNTRRRQDLREDLRQRSERLASMNIETAQVFDDNGVFIQCLLFIVLGVLVFVLPRYVHFSREVIPDLVAAVFFFWTPLFSLLRMAANYMRAAHALQELQEMEDKIDAQLPSRMKPSQEESPWSGRFSRIELLGLGYSYPARQGTTHFHVGPVDLTLHPGEVVFIVGGNGSGKSTLMRLLSSLYPATSGNIRVDGMSVGPQNIGAYRELISTIFTDFHLFQRFYGLLDAKPEAVQALIAQMQLSGQTDFAEARFTRQELSTGQRKRLAMVVALLEDRPLYIFDEWAADQDAEFRHYFYRELLPLLRSRGKTVIAVSHDDRYFSCADRVVTMEYGQVRSITKHPAVSSLAP